MNSLHGSQAGNSVTEAYPQTTALPGVVPHPASAVDRYVAAGAWGTRSLPAAFRHAATTYAVHHWHRWPVVGLLREAWLWSVWRPAWTVRMASVYLGRPAWIAWSQIVGFWLLTPLALYGFVLARRRRIPVAPLVTLVAFAAAVGLLVVGNLRYRLPAELAWVLLAAIAVDRLVLGAPRGAPAASVGGGDLR